MIVINPHVTCRIGHTIDVRRYNNGVIEILGKCWLTGKMVIRYVSTTLKIYEYDEKNEKFIPMEDGVCKDHFNKIDFMMMPLKYDNILEFKKKEISEVIQEATSA